MLWEIFWRYKNTISLSFCLSFSTLCLIWQTNPLARAVNVFGKVSDRISGALNSGLSLPGNIWVEVDKYRALEQRYSQAQKLIEQYRLEKDKFDILKLDNDRLRATLGFQPAQEFPEVRAEVLGVRINSISPRLIIGKGRSSGIMPFMPVIARVTDSEHNIIRCVVGIIAAVDGSSAVVQPIIHPGFRLGVRMPETGQWAMLTGNSGRVTEVLLTFITTDSSPDKSTMSNADIVFQENQKVYTSGEGGIFPPGIPVGVLTREGFRQGEFKTAYLRPYAPISTLDTVTVLLKKPADWSEHWERESNWEEHLQTEFGQPEYSELTRRPAQNPNRRTGETTLPQADKEQESAGGSEPANPQTGPRRIQNVAPPAGNR